MNFKSFLKENFLLIFEEYKNINFNNVLKSISSSFSKEESIGIYLVGFKEIDLMEYNLEIKKIFNSVKNYDFKILTQSLDLNKGENFKKEFDFSLKELKDYESVFSIFITYDKDFLDSIGEDDANDLKKIIDNIHNDFIQISKKYTKNFYIIEDE